jgi:hypothetical protein
VHFSVSAGDALPFSEELVEKVAAVPGVKLAVPLVVGTAFLTIAAASYFPSTAWTSRTTLPSASTTRSTIRDVVDDSSRFSISRTRSCWDVSSPNVGLDAQ